jgi:hypothetical protein
MVQETDSQDMGNQLAESESILAPRRRDPPPVAETEDLFASEAINPAGAAMPPPPPPPVASHPPAPGMDITTDEDMPSPIRQTSSVKPAGSQPSSRAPTTSTQRPVDPSVIGGPLVPPKRTPEPSVGKGKGSKGKGKAGPASKTGRTTQASQVRYLLINCAFPN